MKVKTIIDEMMEVMGGGGGGGDILWFEVFVVLVGTYCTDLAGHLCPTEVSCKRQQSIGFLLACERLMPGAQHDWGGGVWCETLDALEF